jgi:hypothetical protein
MPEPTAAALNIRKVAERIALAFEKHTNPRGILLTGSGGDGTADERSDLDLIAYFDQLPSLAAIRAWRSALDVPPPGADPDPGTGWGDTFVMEGVECQVGGFLAGGVERRLTELLAGEEPESASNQKIALGLLHGLPLRDDGLIAAWQARVADFPDALAEAMASHHLRIFPFWSLYGQIADRDARLFEVQSLLDGACHGIGALSAANRRYFTSFQFKRMRQHISAMNYVPDSLAERAESLFDVDAAAAAHILRDLVEETVAIVEWLLPAVDTAAVRETLSEGPPPGT